MFTPRNSNYLNFSVGFINNIINCNFKTRDFSPLIERVLAGVVPLVDLYLIFEKSRLKNGFGQT